jgi:hypothetical protein
MQIPGLFFCLYLLSGKGGENYMKEEEGKAEEKLINK